MYNYIIICLLYNAMIYMYVSIIPMICVARIYGNILV